MQAILICDPQRGHDSLRTAALTDEAWRLNILPRVWTGIGWGDGIGIVIWAVNVFYDLRSFSKEDILDICLCLMENGLGTWEKINHILYIHQLFIAIIRYLRWANFKSKRFRG